MHSSTGALEAAAEDQVSPSAAWDSFTFVVAPPDRALDSSWKTYTDASTLDGPTPLLRRVGWALLALDSAGVIRASALGVPPPWITTSFGAKTWAVLRALTVIWSDAPADRLQGHRRSAPCRPPAHSHTNTGDCAGVGRCVHCPELYASHRRIMDPSTYCCC